MVKAGGIFRIAEGMQVVRANEAGLEGFMRPDLASFS